jgi:hypothetical protein
VTVPPEYDDHGARLVGSASDRQPEGGRDTNRPTAGGVDANASKTQLANDRASAKARSD